MAKRTINQRSRSLRPSEKAAFHHITGAGRKRVLRQFFGIAPADADVIAKELDRTITKNLTS